MAMASNALAHLRRRSRREAGSSKSSEARVSVHLPNTHGRTHLQRQEPALTHSSSAVGQRVGAWGEGAGGGARRAGELAAPTTQANSAAHQHGLPVCTCKSRPGCEAVHAHTASGHQAALFRRHTVAYPCLLQLRLQQHGTLCQ